MHVSSNNISFLSERGNGIWLRGLRHSLYYWQMTDINGHILDQLSEMYGTFFAFSSFNGVRVRKIADI